MATQTIPQIKAEVRDRLGTRYSARLRKEGRLPVVIYGHQQEPVHASVNLDEAVEVLHRNAHLVELVLGSQSEPCLVKDIQWNHLGSQIIHLDLARVDLTERVTVEVELEFIGEPAAVKQAGVILEHLITEVEVECVATNIPERIQVDVSAMQIGDTLTVADLKLPEGVDVVTDGETIVASVTEVADEPEPVAAAADAAAEPEVIGRKAKEDEAAAAAAPEKK